MMNLELTSENIDFVIDCVDILQIRGDIFHSKCLSINSSQIDSTGLRIHAGAYVGIRFLSSRILFDNFQIFNSKSNVIEIGCGTGIFGMVGLYNNYSKENKSFNSLTVTDGNISAIDIAKLNYCGLKDKLQKKLDIEMPPVNFTSLSWDNFDDITGSISRYNNGSRFDTVIGCELMYYRTEVKDLVKGVLGLVDNENGYFIHAHVLRRRGQGEELIKLFQENNWETYEVKKNHFMTEEELLNHPEWGNVRCLISSSKENFRNLDDHRFLSVFVEEDEDIIDAYSQNNDFDIFND